jgi:hypothetical protein
MFFLKVIKYLCNLSQPAALIIIFLKPNNILLLTGYILANLPAQDIEKALNSKHMLECIGRLSLPELLVATKEIKPCKYAQLLLRKHASINFCIKHM